MGCDQVVCAGLPSASASSSARRRLERAPPPLLAVLAGLPLPRPGLGTAASARGSLGARVAAAARLFAPLARASRVCGLSFAPRGLRAEGAGAFLYPAGSGHTTPPHNCAHRQGTTLGPGGAPSHPALHSLRRPRAAESHTRLSLSSRGARVSAGNPGPGGLCFFP